MEIQRALSQISEIHAQVLKQEPLGRTGYLGVFSRNGGVFQAQIAVRAASNGQARGCLDGRPLPGTFCDPEHSFVRTAVVFT